MKRIALLLCSLAFTAAAYTAPAQLHEQSLDNIVATVNDNVITQTELNKALHMAHAQLAAENVTPPPEKVLRKQILQRLINNKLQLETAELAGIHISEAELNEAINSIAKQNHLSIHEFYAKIAQDGLTADNYRAQIRESMALQRLQQKEVASRIAVTPEEINSYVHTASLQTQGEKEYHILDYLVPISETPSPEEIAISKKFAEDIATKLRKGSHFSDLASAETVSIQNNDLSWRRLAEVPTVFTQPVTGMKVNEFYGPIQTSNGFHIIQLSGLRSLGGHTAAPKKDEIAQLIFQRKFEDAMQGWITKIRGQAFIMVHDKAVA